MTDIDPAIAIAGRLAERLERRFQIIPTVTLAEAAKSLGISNETMRKLCVDGHIPYIKMIGSTGSAR